MAKRTLSDLFTRHALLPMWSCDESICSWSPDDQRTPLTYQCVHVLQLDSPCTMAYLGGVILAAVAAGCNGTFGSLSKVERVAAARVQPHIFNFWACLGIVISSVPIALLTTTRVRCHASCVLRCTAA